MYLELMEPSEEQQLGYDTGCGHPIGHLSEIGFFVPDMDGARMVKIDTDSPSGFPTELIDVDIGAP